MEQDKNDFRLFNTASGKTVARYTLGRCVIYQLNYPRAVEQCPVIDDPRADAQIIQFPKNSAERPEPAA